MTPSANTAGGRRVTRWTRESIIEKILEWNDLLRRAAVLGRLEPVAGALARAGMARRALPRGDLAVHQRRQAPVRRVVRRRRARGRPGAPPLRSAPSPGRCRASRRRAARADGSPQRRRGAAGGVGARARRRASRRRAGARGSRRPSVVPSVPRTCWTTRAARARRASERERRARGARERVAVAAARVARRPRRRPSSCCPPTRRRACARRTTRRRPRSRDTHEARRTARAPPRPAPRTPRRVRSRPSGWRRGPAELASGGGARAAVASRRRWARRWQAARDAEARAAAAERRARELAALVCGESRQLTRGRAGGPARRRPDRPGRHGAARCARCTAPARPATAAR